MKIEVTEVKKLPEGKHIGVIIDVQYRDVTFGTKTANYTDVHIESNDVVLTAGYPTVITEESGLGQLLMRFEERKLVVGAQIDPNKVLVGQQCSFVVIEKPGKKDATRMFSNIVALSVKPLAPITATTTEEIIATAEKKAMK